VSPAPGRVTHRATPFPRLVAPDVVHLWTEPSQPRVSTMATWCSPVRCETAEAPLEIARISRENWLKLLARHRTPGVLPPLLLRASEPLGAEAIVVATATFVIVAARGT
jgi:hypothetical protein